MHNGDAQHIYVHIPFCESKCHYCDFYSIAGKPNNAFINAIRKEIRLNRGALAPKLNTIYFGGGTPSNLSIEQLRQVAEEFLRMRSPIAETAIELNPFSARKEFLSEVKTLGFNRISLGVQSLSDDRLQWLGRAHSAKKALSSLDEIFSSGFENVSVDVILGIPGQTDDELKSTLNGILNFPIKHLSCYLLTLHETNFRYQQLPSDEDQLRQYLLVDEILSTHGFRHYEISNYCREGFQSQHNLAYWKQGSYLGFGPSAHSFDAKKQMRWKNISSIDEYTKDLSADLNPVESIETLTNEQQEIEKWMLALRLDEGFPEEWLDTDKRKSARESLQKEHLLERNEFTKNLRLTPRGFAVADEVIRNFI